MKIGVLLFSTVARCILSLGSKARSRYSNWETWCIRYEPVSKCANTKGAF